ncbi:Uridine kinase [Candidatus Cyrtobacter comes]|uniref:uridine/cytidine kinase n=1 Tax=Candidatus Cyrtobacter comes TaxID=675776 RepID=A0ABU5L7C9_9RICK|nr:uridine kinase [Candidatus Cyrtobacter comes]MDZ5762042.1 Uridine kinase [Candidatus Cyrtobacter comes]
MKTSTLVAVSGLSGSGKTRFVQNLYSFFDPQQVTLFSSDNYYKNQDHIPIQLRDGVNYDHPSAIDADLMAEHIQKLAEGDDILMPLYDFVTHTSIKGMEIMVRSAPVIIVEGLFLLAIEKIREMMDLKIFIDVPHDVCLVRRMYRDMKQKKRDLDTIMDMHMNNVSNMAQDFIIPSKRHADILFSRGGDNEHALNMLKLTIQNILNNQ